MSVRALVLALVLAQAGAPSESALPPSIPHPRIQVLKAKRELRLYSGERLLRTYPIGLGTNPVPPKARQGDRATPEGAYVVCIKNPHSAYLLSLGLNYPNAADAERGLRAGLITPEQHRKIVRAAQHKAVSPWNTKLGGEIFIHGHGSSSDWTWGCVALDDADIRELYPVIPVGTPVVIEP